VWNPSQGGVIGKIDEVQRRFLRMIAFKLGMQNCSLNEAASKLCGITSLENKPKMADMIFVYELINGTVDFPHLLTKLKRKVLLDF